MREIIVYLQPLEFGGPVAWKSSGSTLQAATAAEGELFWRAFCQYGPAAVIVPIYVGNIL
jgi:hypothetical protein